MSENPPEITSYVGKLISIHTRYQKEYAGKLSEADNSTITLEPWITLQKDSPLEEVIESLAVRINDCARQIKKERKMRIPTNWVQSFEELSKKLH